MFHLCLTTTKLGVWFLRNTNIFSPVIKLMNAEAMGEGSNRTHMSSGKSRLTKSSSIEEKERDILIFKEYSCSSSWEYIHIAQHKSTNLHACLLYKFHIKMLKRFPMKIPLSSNFSYVFFPPPAIQHSNVHFSCRLRLLALHALSMSHHSDRDRRVYGTRKKNKDDEWRLNKAKKRRLKTVNFRLK